MALTASDLAAIKSSLEVWEIIKYVGAGVVFLGVVGEYIAEFTKFAEKRGLEKSLSKLSTLVLLVGLAVELLALVRTSQLSGYIITQLEEQVAATTREAESIRRETIGFSVELATAKKNAADANERAAKLEVTAANLKKDNLALETLIQPRNLDKGNSKVLADACAGFSKLGLRIEVVPFVFDLDGRRLARQLAAVLPNAEVKGPTTPTTEAGANEGLIVSGDADIQDAVKQLVAALNSVKIAATAGPPIDTRTRSHLKKLVAIRVGLKPLPETEK